VALDHTAGKVAWEVKSTAPLWGGSVWTFKLMK
jgi:hypothetical protein